RLPGVSQRRPCPARTGRRGAGTGQGGRPGRPDARGCPPVRERCRKAGQGGKHLSAFGPSRCGGQRSSRRGPNSRSWLDRSRRPRPGTGAAMSQSIALPPARYDYGGDEFIFVELSEEMSMEANIKATLITQELSNRGLDGIIDICPSNASYLVRYDPDTIAPRDIMDLLQGLDDEFDKIPDGFTMQTRIVDVPILYDDPWTHEAMMRFRSHHQDPDSTDLEYGARTNG